MAQDAEELAILAEITFPLACPPGHTPENIAEHLRHVLSAEKFLQYATSSEFTLAVATDQEKVIGFTLVDYRTSADPDVQAHVGQLRTSAELSKLYVHPDAHGAGIAQRLVNVALAEMTKRDIEIAWLTVSQLNDRANAFYEKSGFVVVAAKKYQVGDVIDDDYLRVRVLGTQGELDVNR